MEVKRWNACISYFKSLKNFYVNDLSRQPIIQEISTSLQQLNGELLTLVSLKPGDLVAAKHESDGLWYRAKVLDLGLKTCTVQFIDYGNIELTSKIQKLPNKLCSYHSLAYHCILNDIENEENVITTNTDIFDSVFEYMTSIKVILKFLNNEEPYIVKMKWDNRNIKILLNNIISYGITFETYKSLKKNYQSDTKIEVNLIHTESINEFYVQTVESKKEEKKVEYELSHGTNWQPMTEYKFGKNAIAKSTADNRWYRVRILKILDKNKCTCYLIDYGIQNDCTEFYEAVGFLKSASPTIKRCSLYMPNTKKKMMFDILSQCFIDEMAVSKYLKTEMSIIKSGEPCLVELYVDNLNVAAVIKPKPVTVSHVFHVNALTVQICKSKIHALDNELNIKTFKPVKNPKIGTVYGVLIQDEWYRGKLKHILYEDNMFEVILLDMGDTLFNAQHLYNLPERINNVKYLTVHCSLGVDDQLYSSLKLRNLCDIHNNSKFMMFILKHNPKDISGHIINLFLDNKDVKSIIKNDN